MPDKLIIFDYSGTLSLEAVAFGRSDNLLRHLQKSGLFALGVDNTALFWNIVNETWQEGSTTRAGYKKVMQEFIVELSGQKAIAKQEEIVGSVSKFVDAYLDHSRIDECWRSILKKLSLDESVNVIVATDHYAEATDAIINHLAQWSIQAITLTAGVKSNFIVANSADVGVHKSHREFWRMVKNILQLNCNRILLIDDFGQNEQPDDAYVDPEKISERICMTQKILRDIFAADVQSISFVAKNKQVTEMIAEASAAIDEFLMSKPC